jgi:hypothetical protein
MRCQSPQRKKIQKHAIFPSTRDPTLLPSMIDLRELKKRDASGELERGAV